jgi:hypothetical protein
MTSKTEKTTINFIDGEKGGTGKSWVARTMHHVFDAQNRSFMGIEADTANPTYHNVYATDTRKIPFSIDPEEEDVSDELFDLALESDLIVSLPAQAHRALSKWLLGKNVIKLAQEQNIILKKWWVSDGEEDSIELFCQSAELYGDGVQHVFVKNEGRCSKWHYFDHHKKTIAIIRKYKIPVIGFPKLSDMRRIEVNAQRLTFAKAAISPQFGILGKGQIELYLQQAEADLVMGGLWAEPADAAMVLARSTAPKAIAKSDPPAEADPGAKK